MGKDVTNLEEFEWPYTTYNSGSGQHPNYHIRFDGTDICTVNSARSAMKWAHALNAAFHRGQANRDTGSPYAFVEKKGWFLNEYQATFFWSVINIDIGISKRDLAEMVTRLNVAYQYGAFSSAVK